MMMLKEENANPKRLPVLFFILIIPVVVNNFLKYFLKEKKGLVCVFFKFLNLLNP